jgi:hypothetical protein
MSDIIYEDSEVQISVLRTGKHTKKSPIPRKPRTRTVIYCKHYGQKIEHERRKHLLTAHNIQVKNIYPHFSSRLIL